MVILLGSMNQLMAEEVDCSARLTEELAGREAIENLEITLTLEKELLATNPCSNKELFGKYKRLESLLIEAKRLNRKKIKTERGVVYAGFFNNFDYKVSPKGIMILPKEDGILHRGYVIVMPNRPVNLMFNLYYGGLNSYAPDRLTYVYIYYYMGSDKQAIEYPYYYYLSDNAGHEVRTIKWTPGKNSSLPDITGGWDFTARDADAQKVFDILSLMQRLKTGFPMTLTLSE